MSEYRTHLLIYGQRENKGKKILFKINSIFIRKWNNDDEDNIGSNKSHGSNKHTRVTIHNITLHVILIIWRARERYVLCIVSDRAVYWPQWHIHLIGLSLLNIAAGKYIGTHCSLVVYLLDDVSFLMCAKITSAHTNIKQRIGLNSKCQFLWKMKDEQWTQKKTWESRKNTEANLLSCIF